LQNLITIPHAKLVWVSGKLNAQQLEAVRWFCCSGWVFHVIWKICYGPEADDRPTVNSGSTYIRIQMTKLIVVVAALVSGIALMADPIVGLVLLTASVVGAVLVQRKTAAAHHP
jgi:hypothetical protein